MKMTDRNQYTRLKVHQAKAKRQQKKRAKAARGLLRSGLMVTVRTYGIIRAITVSPGKLPPALRQQAMKIWHSSPSLRRKRRVEINTTIEQFTTACKYSPQNYEMVFHEPPPEHDGWTLNVRRIPPDEDEMQEWREELAEAELQRQKNEGGAA
jgi:hypothetical protein